MHWSLILLLSSLLAAGQASPRLVPAPTGVSAYSLRDSALIVGELVGTVRTRVGLEPLNLGRNKTQLYSTALRTPPDDKNTIA